MKSFGHFCSYLLAAYCLLFTTVSCTRNNLFEKSVVVPGHAWKNSFKPEFTFTIKDSSSPYQFLFIIRHNEKYNYNNIYIKLHIKPPGNDSIQQIQLPLLLANNEGWLGSGMDDIYEHRIELGAPQTLRPGTYTFTLEQVMREDPLENVLDIGLRIEKK